MSIAEPRQSESASTPAAANRPIGSPRNFVLACIGLLSLLADEVPALLERSVQRGTAVVERAQLEARRRRAAPPMSEELQNELSRRGLPTHHDLETLLQQVAELEQQIDQLASQRAGEG